MRDNAYSESSVSLLDSGRIGLDGFTRKLTLTLHKIRVQNALDYASKGLWAIFKGESVLNIGHSLENGPMFLDGVT